MKEFVKRALNAIDKHWLRVVVCCSGEKVARGSEPIKAGVIAGIVCVSILLILVIIGFIILRLVQW